MTTDTPTSLRCTHCSVPQHGNYIIGHDGLPHTIANLGNFKLASQLASNNIGRSIRVAYVAMRDSPQGRRLLCRHCARLLK